MPVSQIGPLEGVTLLFLTLLTLSLQQHLTPCFSFSRERKISATLSCLFLQLALGLLQFRLVGLELGDFSGHLVNLFLSLASFFHGRLTVHLLLLQVFLHGGYAPIQTTLLLTQSVAMRDQVM